MNTPKSMSEEETSYTAMDLWSDIFGNSTTANGNSQGYVHYSNFVKAIEDYALTKQIEVLERLHIGAIEPKAEIWVSLDGVGHPSEILKQYIAELRKQQEGGK